MICNSNEINLFNMKDIALVIQARSNSKRCKNKMLRSFANSNLFKIQLEKYKNIYKENKLKVYAAVGEEKFFKILNDYPLISIIKRNEASVNGDKIDDVFNYLNLIKESTICFINPCAPLMGSHKVLEAIEAYTKNNYKSLTTVLKKHTWYYDHLKKPINNNLSGNTKDLDEIYECTHNFHIFRKDFFIKNLRYWDNQLNDPFLFEVDQFESLDIDTEEEFQFVEKVYNSMVG